MDVGGVRGNHPGVNKKICPAILLPNLSSKSDDFPPGIAPGADRSH